MLSNSRYALARSYGEAVAHSNFIWFLNPKNRGPNFRWSDLEHICSSQAKFGIYTCSTKGDWGKDQKEMEKQAATSAKYTIQRCLKESDVENWIPTLLQETIEKHLEKYEDTTGGLSFIKYDHPDYKAILSYGKEALPTLFKCIDDHGWCVIALLHEITKQSPVKHENRGKYYKVIDDWKNWGKENGYSGLIK